MTDVENRLLTLAAERANLAPDEVLSKLAADDWQNIERMYDWRNYIPDELMRLWPSLPKSARLTALILAFQSADSEDWDSLLSE